LRSRFVTDSQQRTSPLLKSVARGRAWFTIDTHTEDGATAATFLLGCLVGLMVTPSTQIRFSVHTGEPTVRQTQFFSCQYAG
jgi:hypothetical protein